MTTCIISSGAYFGILELIIVAAGITAVHLLSRRIYAAVR